MNKNYYYKISPRAFSCPDGVTRIIRLENSYWHELDWLRAEKGYDRNHIIAFVHEQTRDKPDPAGAFADLLAYYIHHAMRLYIAEADDLANDDWFRPEFAMKCQYMLTRSFNQSATNDITDLELRMSLRPEFNMAAYRFPKRKIAVKSQRTFFSPLEA